MCTITNEVEEPIVEVPPRDIDELLLLETYQGMTDEEIELIITYREQRALTDADFLVRTTTQIEYMEQLIADNQASVAHAQSVVESIIGSGHIEVPILQPRTYTPRGTEVSNG